MNTNSQYSEQNPFDFIPYIRFLLKKREIVGYGMSCIVIFAIVYVFIVSKREYKVETTFLPPISTTMKYAMSVSEISIPSMQTYEIMNDQIVTVFQSDAIKRKLIDKFDLYRKFGLTHKPNKFEIAKKKMKKMFGIDVSDMGYMSLTKILGFSLWNYSTSKDTAFLMNQYTYLLLDSSIRSISSERARRNRVYIESQLDSNKCRLDSLQSALKVFQEKNLSLDVSDQMGASFQVYSKIKGILIQQEIALTKLKSSFSTKVPEMEDLEKSIALYQDRLKRFESDTTVDAFPSFNRYRELYPAYNNLKREIDIKNYILIYLTKEKERAKLEEERAVSNLVVVDPPVIPDYPSRPKRAIIFTVISCSLTALFLLILMLSDIAIRYYRENRGYFIK